MNLDLDKVNNLDEAIYRTLGFASVCWTEAPKGGFREDLCREAALELKQYIENQQPWLGYATNLELMEELKTRHSLGHTDPGYKTMSDG